MTLTNPNRLAVPGRTAVLVLAGIFFLGSGLTARAQSKNDDDSPGGLEGTWRLQVTVRDCNTYQPLRTFPAVFAFAKGGTATDTTAGQLPSLATPGLGVWQHTEDHNYNAVTEAFVFSSSGVWIQTHRLTRTIQVSTDGNSFSDQVALQIFDTAGNLIATGCATSVGIRFE